ncbi:hypothetical protein BT96DRAFT_419528 [Gymnopus androsaceus JB14]|uniref:F-box domain-containing protein n=1 Tax=Gymnopus androsaceus JB14 TaxID=1447944 RepID=A0A6A4I6Q4_9AGAR|nr:hypothetical protein BT96DRAFT_419528 [Gymnopus androsaceus JB14]
MTGIEFKSHWPNSFLPSSVNPFSRANLISILRSGHVPSSIDEIETMEGLKSDIRRALVDCEKEISEKEEQFRALQLRLNGLKKTRRELKIMGDCAIATTAAIRKLPTEILREIFHLIAFSDSEYTLECEFGDLMSPVRVVSRICSRWKQVALSYHDLWLSMRIDLGILKESSTIGNTFVEHLRRSGKTLPLRLSIKAVGSRWKMGNKAQFSVWNALLDESRRWRDIVLDVDQYFLEAALENFILPRQYHSLEHEERQNNESRFPILRTLQIKNATPNFNLFWPLPLLHSFQVDGQSHLSLDEYPIDIAHITQLAIPDGKIIGGSLNQLFKRCRHLEDATLGGFSTNVYWTSATFSEAYTHTRLTRLCLKSKNHRFERRKFGLESVSFPNLTHLELTGADRMDSQWERNNCIGLGQDVAALITHSNSKSLYNLTLSSFPKSEALPVLHATSASLLHLKINHPRVAEDMLFAELSDPNLDLVPKLASFKVILTAWVVRELVDRSDNTCPELQTAICRLIESRCSLTPPTFLASASASNLSLPESKSKLSSNNSLPQPYNLIGQIQETPISG